MKSSTILVTGGAGFIGSHTVVELIASGYEVVVVDNLSNSDITLIHGVEKITGKKITFHQIDCCDNQAMQQLFERYKFDAVIHFAGFKSISESIKFPLKYYQNNLGSLTTLLENMEKQGCSNLIYSSSATVYGQPATLPITESTPLQDSPSPYGISKQICERIIEDVAQATPDFRAISLRYFNPIGAHPSAEIGELPMGVPSNLLPFITQTAVGIHPILEVFGGDYATPDGTALRDYIDVVDLAKAHVAAIKRALKGESDKKHEFFNIGTGRAVSVLELIREFERSNNLKLNYKIVDRRPGDIEQIWADTGLANRLLKWRAERSLSDTLQSAWQWEKRHRNLL